MNIEMTPDGSIQSKIMLVGEALGAQERRVRRPFVGPSGKLLNSLLQTAGITRSECYITNVIKEQPPANNIAPFIDVGRREPFISPSLGKPHVEYLKREVEQSGANVIVALGAVASYVLTKHKEIMKWRGSIVPCTLVPGKKVIPCLHPSFVLRGNAAYKAVMINDFIKVQGESKFSDLILPPRDLKVAPTYEESIDYLESCMKCEYVALDIETNRKGITCISFARTGRDALSIPLVDDGYDYFNPHKELEIWKRIAKIIESPGRPRCVLQNANFDLTYLFRKNEIWFDPKKVEDTMIGQSMIAPDLPKGLDFITSIHTRDPYYKDEGKRHIRLGVTSEQFWRYNARDSAITLDAFSKILKQVKEDGNFEVYRMKCDMLGPLVYMESRGIRVDKVGLVNHSKKLEKDLEALQMKLNNQAGCTLNPNSSKQLKDYFYIQKGHRTYINRKTGTITVDEQALKKISASGLVEAQTILEMRSKKKLKSTYLDVNLDKDHRLRCSYNPCGTKWTRLSSSISIFDTGTNMQNLPPEMKTYLLADKDYMIFNVDLSQAENRIVAHIAPDDNMIKAFENYDAGQGPDVHRITAGMIFNKKPEDVSDDGDLKDNPDSAAPIGGGRYSERFWGKKCNHAFNYDFGPVSFANLYELPQKDGKFLHAAYRRAYPGVTRYHEWVKFAIRSTGKLKNLLGFTARFLGDADDKTFKEAYSFIPQSSVGHIVALRGLNFIFYERELKPVELLNQVHDSIVFQIPISIGFDKMADCLCKIRDSLEIPLVWNDRKFKIPCEFEGGTTLKKCSPVDMSHVNLPDHLEEIYGTHARTQGGELAELLLGSNT